MWWNKQYTPYTKCGRRLNTGIYRQNLMFCVYDEKGMYRVASRPKRWMHSRYEMSSFFIIYKTIKFECSHFQWKYSLLLVSQNY